MPKTPDERQAAALEEVSKTLKSFVRVQTVINENVVALGNFIKARQSEVDESAYEKAVTLMEAYEKGIVSLPEKRRIPVRLWPTGENPTPENDDRPLGWAEVNLNNMIEISIAGADLVNDIEFLTELGEIKGLYLAVEFMPKTNEGGDTNAAE